MGNHYSNDNLKPAVSVTVDMDGREITVKGRVAHTLDTLIRRGEKGLATIETPALRLSHYVFKLREDFVIETLEEEHGGPFPGKHGRYILRSLVTVKDIKRAGEAA